MLVRPKIVPKAWGEEVWIHNDEEYCGKILRFFKAGNKFSLHYNILKKMSLLRTIPTSSLVNSVAFNDGTKIVSG